MDMVLVNSPIYKENNQESKNEYLPPLGLGYIASNLIKNSIDVTILDAVQQGMNTDELRIELYRINPKIIGINIFTINIDIVKIIIESYDYNTRFIIGGQCAKHIYRDIIEWNTTNEIIVVIGEADFITKDIVLEKVVEKAIVSTINRKVYKVDNDSSYYPKNLESTVLYRKVLAESDVENYYGLKERSIITSRGCAFDCAFCGAARSLNKESDIRILTPKSVLFEISELIKEDSSIECIRVLDDLFLRNAKSINDAIDIFNIVGTKWRAMAHIKSFHNISDEYLIKLKKSGCLELFIGIESGSTKIRTLINKMGNIQEIKDTIQRLLKCSINVKGYFIFGFPTETQEDMNESYQLAQYLIEIAKNLEGDFRTSVFQFRPYHGTKLYNKYIDKSDILEGFQENKILSSLIDRSQFNSYNKNFSECDDNILYKYICKTSRL